MNATLILPSIVRVIEGALEGLVCANVALLELDERIPVSPLDARVRYQRERSGFEDWEICTRVLSLGYGDCEDLASWTAAGYRVTGDDEGARAVLYRTGPRMYHCVCLLTSGEIVDVCPALGMRPPQRGHHVGSASLLSALRRARDER